MSGRPLDVLEAAIGDPVTVRLKGGDEYVGTLAGYDQHMNLVLEGSESRSEDATPGGLPNEAVEDQMIIRGDNVVSITP